MKKITFIRHAKVNKDSSTPITAQMLKHWEKAYNDAPIIDEIPQNEDLHQVLNEVDFVFSSTLRRSKDSLALLNVTVNESHSLFNEAQIPALEGDFIKLTPTKWLVLFRLLSLLGFGRWAVTLKKTKAQAKEAASMLIKQTIEYDNVVLMGHGVMNWLISKELQVLGWEIQGKSEHHNWGMTTLIQSK